MSEDSNRNSGVNVAANVHVPHVTLDDIARYSPEKVHRRMYTGGMGIPRNERQAQQVLEKIPASYRAGDPQSASARVTEYISDKDVSHIIARNKGGSSAPNNLKWEEHIPNKARRDKAMTPKEQKALDAKVNSDNLSGAVQRGMESGVKGAVIGAVTTLPFSFLRNSLRVSRGEITSTEAALETGKETLIGGAVGGVTAFTVTAVASAFPPIAVALTAISPVLLVAAGAGMAYEFIKILDDHKEDVRAYYNSLTGQQLIYLQQVEDESIYEHDKNLMVLDEQRILSDKIVDFPRGTGIQGAIDRVQHAMINAERVGLLGANTKLLSSID